MRRAVFYLFFDAQGQVDDYVTYKLERLRQHAEHVFVVSNSPLDDANRAKLETVADTVWVRENVGLDVWAYKEAMQMYGESRLAELDELILMNYTFFGPIGSFDPMFAEMDARDDLDFWGISEHDEVVPHPFDSRLERMDRHIQSHWIAVRSSMFRSQEWRSYWDDMPMITSYFDSVNRHEGRFTQHFSDAGFRHHVLHSVDDYPSQHPIMDDTAQVLRDGCPILKRRTFFHDPLYLEFKAVNGRELLELAETAGYPTDLMLTNLARTSEPRVLATNLSLLEVMPETDLGDGPVPDLRIVAIAHLYYPELTGEVLDRFAHLPAGYDLVITTTDEERRAAIEAVLAERGESADVRVVGSNRGRDISAFLVGCRDVLLSGRYDLVVKLHSKRSPQDGATGELFKRHLFDNLLASPGYAANVLRLFARHATLGMVFPPVVHLGYPTLGHSWFGNKARAQEEAKRIGITVPFDESTPLATNGSMFIARPEALRLIVEAGYDYDDFPDETGYTDGGLSHVLERLMTYSSLSQGLHVREVMSPASAALNYGYLEYKYQSVAAHLPGYPLDQVPFIQRLQRSQQRSQKRAPQRRTDRAKGGKAPVGTRRPPKPDPSEIARRDLEPLVEPTMLTTLKARAGESPRARRALAPTYRAARRVYRSLRP